MYLRIELLPRAIGNFCTFSEMAHANGVETRQTLEGVLMRKTGRDAITAEFPDGRVMMHYTGQQKQQVHDWMLESGTKEHLIAGIQKWPGTPYLAYKVTEVFQLSSRTKKAPPTALLLCKPLNSEPREADTTSRYWWYKPFFESLGWDWRPVMGWSGMHARKVDSRFRPFVGGPID